MKKELSSETLVQAIDTAEDYQIRIDDKKKVFLVGKTDADEQEKNEKGFKAEFPVIKPEMLGSRTFRESYRTKYSYYCGAMANGISSVEMLISLGREGILGSLGTGGVQIETIGEWIDQLNENSEVQCFLVNLLSMPLNPQEEMRLVQLFIQKGVYAIEASAFLDLSKALVYYRVSGLSRAQDGRILVSNHIIAKVSREEVAEKFMLPPPKKIVEELQKEGFITEEQKLMSEQIPMADDITVEADSAGHTDNRPLVSLFPAMKVLKEKYQTRYGYRIPLRIGAAGGIGTPDAAAAMFLMGADYIVTGSINQSCGEAGTSEYVKNLLQKTHMRDVVMAPSADMFELGVRVQVLKNGTMFPLNAQKLYRIYCDYDGLEEIPDAIRKSLEEKVFRKPINEVWKDTKTFMLKKDPLQIKRAEADEKFRMALIFRWYLGNSSKWAVKGMPERAYDMQIWCGQSMGAFNLWTEGSRYESAQNRKVAEIAGIIMKGAAYLMNVGFARSLGAITVEFEKYPV